MMIFRVRRLSLRFLSLALAFMVLCGTGSFLNADRAHASPGSAQIILSNDLLIQYGLVKTVDLTDSGIDIYITQSDRDRLMKEAKAEAEKFFEDRKISDGVYGAYLPSGEAKPSADQQETYEVSDAKLARLKEYKTNEIFNIKLSELFKERYNGRFKAEFEFSLVPLAADGSEDSKHGVDGTDIKRGVLEGSGKVGSVKFGESDEYYDEILSQMMSGIFIDGDTTHLEIDPFYKENPDPPLPDGREPLTHTIMFDKGQLRTSDDSQTSTGVDRSDTNWPGDHCLLDVCDSLAAYDVEWPEWSYVNTFNLHFNPMVTYITDYVRSNMIAYASFNRDGRLVSVSKPVIGSGSIIEVLNKQIDVSGLEPGRYRYKLQETKATPSALPNGSKFIENKESMIIDIVVDSSGDGDSSQITRVYTGNEPGDLPEENIAYYEHDALSMTRFTNRFTPVVNKTVNETGYLKLDSIKEEFRYKITANIPAGVDSYSIYDEMVDVLAFGDRSLTKVMIGSETLSNSVRDSVISYKGNRMTFRPSKAQLEEWAGMPVTISFYAKLRENADLSPYAKTGVPNIAAVVLDGVEYYSSDENPPVVVLGESSDPVGTTTSKTQDENDRSTSKTGDDTDPFIILMLMMVSALGVTITLLRRHRI